MKLLINSLQGLFKKLPRKVRLARTRRQKVLRRRSRPVVPGQEEVGVEKRRRCVGSEAPKLSELAVDFDVVEPRRKLFERIKRRRRWLFHADGDAQTSTWLCRRIF